MYEVVKEQHYKLENKKPITDETGFVFKGWEL